MSAYFVGATLLVPDGLDRIQIPVYEGTTKTEGVLACLLFGVLEASGCKWEMDESSPLGAAYDPVNDVLRVTGELKSGGEILAMYDRGCNGFSVLFSDIPENSPIARADLEHALEEAGKFFEDWGCYKHGNQWTSRYLT